MSSHLKLPNQEEFPQEGLNKIRLYKDRGKEAIRIFLAGTDNILLARYDYWTVHSIVDSTLVSHVSFIKEYEGQQIPMNMPLTMVLGRYDPLCRYADYGDEFLKETQEAAMKYGAVEAYLHGNSASMLLQAIRLSKGGSIPVCISSTKGKRYQKLKLEYC